MSPRGVRVDGAKVQAAREALRMSTAQLGKAAGVTGAHIRQIETERRLPSLSLVGKLESALKVSAKEIGADLPPRRGQRR